MFVLSNFLIAIANILNTVLTVFYWLILIRAILSWVNPDPYNPIVQFLYSVTDPVFAFIRKILPFPLQAGMIDFSPWVAFLLIIFLKSFLVATLFDIARRLQY